MIFRREPLHKKLAREAKLEQTDPAPLVDPGPHWGNAGIHGVPRPRRWDAVASAEAAGLAGDEVHFVALPNGDLVVDEDEPADTLAPLADAIEQTIQPRTGPRPSARARTSGRSPRAASRLPSSRPKARRSSSSSTRAHARSPWTAREPFGTIPELERLGARESDSYVVRAKRLDENLWEVTTSAL